MRVDFQSTLFAPDAPAEPGPSLAPLAPERTVLEHGAWLDVQRNWLAGADDVFAAMVRAGAVARGAPPDV